MHLDEQERREHTCHDSEDPKEESVEGAVIAAATPICNSVPPQVPRRLKQDDEEHERESKCPTIAEPVVAEDEDKYRRKKHEKGAKKRHYPAERPVVPEECSHAVVCECREVKAVAQEVPPKRLHLTQYIRMMMEALGWLLIVAMVIGVALAPAFPAVRRRLGLSNDTPEARAVRRFLASPLRAIRDDRGELRPGIDLGSDEDAGTHRAAPQLAYPQQVATMDDPSELATHVDLLRRDREVFARAGNRWAEANVLNMIGFISERQGRFEAAADLHGLALKLFRETGDPIGEGDSLSNLGVVFGRMERIEEGAKCHRAALDIRARMDDARVANSNNNLGVLLARSKPERASSYFATAEALAKAAQDNRVLGKAINNATVLELDLAERGNPDHLRRRFEQCLPLRDESADPRGTAKTRNNLGVLHTMYGDYSAAERSFNDAATLAGTVEDHVGLLHVLENWLLLAEMHEHRTREPSWIADRIASHVKEYALPTRTALVADCEAYPVEVGAGEGVGWQVALLSSGSATPADAAQLEGLLGERGFAGQ